MDWARQTRHELKTFIEQLALFLLLQVARQRSRFPPLPPPPLRSYTPRRTTRQALGDFWNHKQFRPMWLEDLLGNHTTLSPLFLPSWDSLMTLLRQARTPASQLLETTSPSIVQLIDHLLLADMSRTIASSLIISRSFQTKPFFQKVNLTTGLRDEVIKMDDVITVDDVITSGSLKCSLSERVL